MTNQYRNVIAKNPLIALEASTHGKIVNKPKTGHFFAQKSEAQKAREALTARYESRTNQCPDCFTAVPLTGYCDCQE